MARLTKGDAQMTYILSKGISPYVMFSFPDLLALTIGVS